MGVFWAGFKRLRNHFSLEQDPLLLADMRVVCGKGASDSVRLRRVVANGSLPDAGSGLGSLPDDAVLPRSAAAMAPAFLGVRRASEVVQLLRGHVRVNVQAVLSLWR